MHKHSACCILVWFLVSIANAAEPAKPLAGQVVDENNQPLVGARVVAWGGKEGCDSLQQLASTETDADGRFSFDEQLRDNCSLILANKEGKCLDWAYLALARGADLSLRLEPPTEIEGAIVDEAGQPIADVTVDASIKRQTPYIAPSLSHGILNTKTDVQGRFRFSNLPSEAKARFDMTAPGYARALAEGPFSPGQKGLRFVLPPEGRLEGTVVEKGTGKALADVWVQAWGSVTSGQHHTKAKTDKDGRFHMTGLSGGKYNIEIVGHDDATLPRWVSAQEKNDKLPFGIDQGIPVETGTVVSGVKIEAIKGGTLEVIVIDAATKKAITASNAWVTICPASDLRITSFGSTGKDGTARLCLSPGTYVVKTIEASGYRYEEEKSEPFEVDSEKPRRVTVAVAAMPKQVTVAIRDLFGNVAPGAKVQVIRMLGPPKNLTAGDDGQLTVESEDMAPLACFLLARHARTNLNLMGLGFAAIGEQPKEIGLALPVRVVGTVLDSNRQPIAGADILAQIDASHMGRYGVVATAKTDNEGRYQIDLAADGSTGYVISVKASGYPAAETAVLQLGHFQLPKYSEIPPAATVKERLLMTVWVSLLLTTQPTVKAEELILRATNRVVRGIVKDRSGTLVPGTVITAKPISGPAFPDSVVSDEKGQFTLEHLDDAEVIYLFARVPGRGWTEQMSTIHPGQEEVTVTLGPSHWD